MNAADLIDMNGNALALKPTSGHIYKLQLLEEKKRLQNILKL